MRLWFFAAILLGVLSVAEGHSARVVAPSTARAVGKDVKTTGGEEDDEAVSEGAASFD